MSKIRLKEYLFMMDKLMKIKNYLNSNKSHEARGVHQSTYEATVKFC